MIISIVTTLVLATTTTDANGDYNFTGLPEGDDYSVWNDDRLIATYHRPGGYPADPLQLRLVNAKARIHQLRVRSDWVK